MSANLPLTWANKLNSPLLADFIAKHGAEYCMTAEEINQMRDAVNEMAVVQQSVFRGSVVPADTPSGTGARFWFTVIAGTYTNFGGVVVTANSLALISVTAAGAYSVSQTAFVTVKGDTGNTGPTGATGATGATGGTGEKGDTGIAKIETWTAKGYASTDQVNYLGKDWRANAATILTDVPGTSSKWVERLDYVSKSTLFVTTHPEFLIAFIDVNDVILFGIKKDGTSYIPKGLSDDAVIEINKKNNYNITKEVPLGTGLYYNDITAIAAVPVVIRKVGLILSYATNATNVVNTQFIGADISTWSNISNWKKFNISTVLDNNEFIWAITDANDQILLGIRYDGNLYAPKAEFSNVNQALLALQTGKVDKDGAKVLSDINFDAAKNIKLNAIETGAQVNTFNKTDAVGAVVQNAEIPTNQAVYNALQALVLNPTPTTSLLYNYFTVAASDAPTNVKLASMYVCDGTNDQVEINACIQAMPRTGGKLVLSAGRFNIGSSIIIDRVMTFEGQGHSLSLSNVIPLLSNTLLIASSDVNVISINPTSGGSNELKGLTIRDMHISGINRRTSTKAGIYVGMGIDICLFHNVSIDNNYIGFHSPTTSFLDAVNITSCSIQRNKLAIYIGYAAFPRITNNIIFDSLGIENYGLQGTVGTTEVATTPIPVNCGGVLIMSGVAIIANNTFGRMTFDDSSTNTLIGASGITILGSGCTGSIISGNTFSQNDGNCIELRTFTKQVAGTWVTQAAPQRLSIIGNSFDNFGNRTLPETKQNAIYIQDSRGVVISNNTMTNSYETGDAGRTWETKNLVYESDTISTNSIWSGKNIITNNSIVSANPSVGHVQGSRIRSTLTINQNNILI